MIDKPILELLTFRSNPDFVDFLLKKLNFQAVIKSAASAAFLDLQGSPRTTARHADGGARGLPCKSREAALAADLITA